MNLNFTIPGAPITKKNSMRLVPVKGHVIPIPSKAYKDYEAAAGYYLPNKWAMIDRPVNVCCVYFMPTHRRVDLANLLSATCDILTHYGVLKDDNSNIIVSHDGSRVGYDKDRPRAEITIEEVPHES